MRQTRANSKRYLQRLRQQHGEGLRRQYLPCEARLKAGSKRTEQTGRGAGEEAAGPGRKDALKRRQGGSV